MSLRCRIENLEAGLTEAAGDSDRPAVVIYAPILDADGKPTGEYNYRAVAMHRKGSPTTATVYLPDNGRDPIPSM